MAFYFCIVWPFFVHEFKLGYQPYDLQYYAMLWTKLPVANDCCQIPLSPKLQNANRNYYKYTSTIVVSLVPGYFSRKAALFLRFCFFSLAF